MEPIQDDIERVRNALYYYGDTIPNDQDVLEHGLSALDRLVAERDRLIQERDEARIAGDGLHWEQAWMNAAQERDRLIQGIGALVEKWRLTGNHIGNPDRNLDRVVRGYFLGLADELEALTKTEEEKV